MRAWIAFLAFAAVLTPACGTSDLEFRLDDRVEIIEPSDREVVRIPIDIRWSVENFEITGPSQRADEDAGYFGLFVDGSPQAPGETIESLFADDESCNDVPGCPDEQFLAGRDIFKTTQTSFTIRNLPDTEEGERRELHEVTIVLLDGRGRRIGESAYTVEFRVER
jgi:hypothetical protein